MSESDDLDARLKAAGMYTLTEMLHGSLPLDRFTAHTGVVDPASFESWLERRYEEFLRMRIAYDLGDQPKDDLYEWVMSHAASYHEVLVNFRAMKERMRAPLTTEGELEEADDKVATPPN